MRKEVLIAILVGGFIGLLVAFGIYRANKAIAPLAQQQARTQTEPQESTPSAQLVVTQPEDDSVVSEDTVVVKGAASPGATIVILYNLGQIILPAKEDGTFEGEVELEGGPNEIKVVAYDAEGNREEKTIMVVYSTEFLGSE